MALSMVQANAIYGAPRSSSGIGNYAAAIAAIVGPLVQGGADVTQTIFEGRQNKAELKQRGREFEAMAPILREQARSAERQNALANIAALRQQQIRSSAASAYAPYVLGAFVAGGIALVLIVKAKGNKRG